MEFNVDKCHDLRVTCKQNPIIQHYTQHGKALETVDLAKYLGVRRENCKGPRTIMLLVDVGSTRDLISQK